MAPGEKIPPPVNVVGNDNAADDAVLAEAREVHRRRTDTAAASVASVEGDFSGMRARRRKRPVNQGTPDMAPNNTSPKPTQASDEATQTRPAPRAQPASTDKQPNPPKPPKAEKTVQPKPPEPAPRVVGGLGNLHTNPFGQPEQFPFGAPGEPLKFENSSLESLGLNKLPDHTHAEKGPYRIHTPPPRAVDEEGFAEASVEKGPWSGTVDTIMVSLAGGNMEWAGHSYREYKKARNAYIQHLNTHRQPQEKEGKLDKESVRLREAYLEARNDLLFIIARRMRPGAGFVPHITDPEAEQKSRKDAVHFSPQDVLKSFEAADGVITDTSFDGVKGLLHEPALVEFYGQAALDSGYQGEVRPLLEGMLTTGIDVQSFTGDAQALQTFSDTRLEYLTALFRKSQEHHDGRSQDFRRSWLDRHFSLFALNKGRKGYLDRYQNAFHTLSLTARDADLLTVRRTMQEVRNLIWRSRMSQQKSNFVRPLAQELARHTRTVSHWLLALRDKFFKRPHDQDDTDAVTLSRSDGLDLWEPSTNGNGLTREDGLELWKPDPISDSFEVSSEDKGGVQVITRMLAKPEVRNFLIASFKLDQNPTTDVVDRLAQLLLFQNLSGARAIFPQGTRLVYRSGLPQSNENGLFIQLGNEGAETRIIDENGIRTGYRSFKYEQ